jgi:hypothetical protein
MQHPDPTPPSCESPLPERLLLRLADLPKLFTRPTWQNVLLLVAGAILAPGKRTVTAALRILGRERETDFPIYHGVLNKAVWSSRAVAGWLLRLLVGTFLSADATVVIGIDDTIERRWGVRSAPAASTAIRSAPRRDTSSKQVACAGYPLNCWCTFRGLAASWACRFSPCSPRPSASMPVSHARPRRCWIVPVRPPPPSQGQALADPPLAARS